MKAKVGYGLLALTILAIGIGVPIATTMGVGGKTKIVTKTHVVTKTKAATFDGTPGGLLKFMRPQGAEEVQCAAGIQAGSRCFILGSQRFSMWVALKPDPRAR